MREFRVTWPGVVRFLPLPVAILARAARMARRLAAFAMFVAALMGALGAARAEEYRIHPGDTLSIYLNGALAFDQPQPVGPDGGVAVPFAGYIGVAGLTAAEAQARIRDELLGRELFSAADVLVVISGYRPVYVTGAVEQPGAYAFAGAMNVAKALALAGGPRTFAEEGGSSPVAMFQYYNAVASLEGERRGLLRATLSLQRLDAHLAGLAGGAEGEVKAPDFTPPAGLELAPGIVEAAIAEERERFALLENEAREARDILVESIRLLEAEIGTVISRRDELQELVAFLADEVANSENLVERGLRVQTTIVTSQRNLSQARVDMLEMERALTTAEQRLAQERKALRELPTTRRLALGRERDEAADAAAAAAAQLAALRQQIALFPGLMEAAAAGEAALPLTYVVERTVGGEPQRMNVEEGFALAPGDLLIVGIATVAH